MSKLSYITNLITIFCLQDKRSKITIIWNKLAYFIPDRLFIKVKFYLRLGYWPNLNNPKTFNEKLQWMKFFSRSHPEYTQMVDKVAAKDYVAAIIGREYIVPTLGVWDNVDDIDWSVLPNKFVIKAAGDSGGIVICQDKAKLDIEAAKYKLKRCGTKQYWQENKEYPYKNVPHRYIAEDLLEEADSTGGLDYKICCFNGEPKFLYLSQGLDNHSTAKMSFLDLK